MAVVVTHMPALTQPAATLGSLSAAAVAVNDIQAVNGIYAANDGTARSLDIMANGATGSAIVLGRWNTTGATAAPLLTLGAAGITASVTFSGTTGDFDVLTDGTAKLAAGSLSGARTITGVTFTDGTATLAAGSLSGARTITGVTFTDGTATLAAGSLSGARTITGVTFTDGTATLAAGSLSGARTITGVTFTDGVATLAAGSLRGAKTIAGVTFTDGVATLAAGNLSGLAGLTVSGPVAAASIDATTVNVASGGGVYLGGVNKPGSWRIALTAGSGGTGTTALVLQAYSGTTYVTKQAIA